MVVSFPDDLFMILDSPSVEQLCVQHFVVDTRQPTGFRKRIMMLFDVNEEFGRET